MYSGHKVAEVFVSLVSKREFRRADAYLKEIFSEVKQQSFFERKKFIFDFSAELSHALELGMQEVLIESLIDILM